MRRLVIVGPRQLARLLAADGASEMPVPELEADIRACPQLYRPEYVDACEKAGAPVLAPSAWGDLCRG
jgi:hypothetical protein